MRRYERASTLLTSNRPVEDWGKLLGDVAAVTAMLDRLLHHGHVLKSGPPELAHQNRCSGGKGKDESRLRSRGSAPNPAGTAPLRPDENRSEKEKRKDCASLPLVGLESLVNDRPTKTC